MIDPQVGLRNVGERLRRIRPEVFVGIPLAHIGRVVFGWGPRLIDKAIVVGEGSYFPGARTLASLRREAPAEPRRSDVGLSAGGTVVVPPIQFTRETPATTDSGAVLEVINECGVPRSSARRCCSRTWRSMPRSAGARCRAWSW
jgi:hypothetical protein